MKQTLPFDDAVYGLGAGMFFVGYFLFGVPSNLLLEKIGARKTLLSIMVIWGVAATAMMFVSTPLQFYVMRFLLGAFEAGVTDRPVIGWRFTDRADLIICAVAHDTPRTRQLSQKAVLLLRVYILYDAHERPY